MSFHFSGHTVVVYHCVAQFSIKTCAGNFKTKEDKFSADEAMKQHLENAVDSIYPEWMREIKV